MTLTDYQLATLRDAAALPDGVPILTVCTFALIRAKLLTIEKTDKGGRAKITAKGRERLGA